MFDFLKRKKCEHDYEFVRNIYGDEINWCGGYRSEWRCKKCGYEWEAFISNRKKGAGCPNCARRVRKNH